MRLIDADKLAITPIDVTDLPQDKCLRVVLWEDVEKAETVDAIPIKWIEEYAEHLAKTNPHGFDVLGVAHEHLGITLMVKDWNLEQWRKENESNISD